MNYYSVILLLIILSCNIKKQKASSDNAIIDSTEWFIDKNHYSSTEDGILYINSKWQLISKESFMDSVYSSVFGSMPLSNHEGRRAQKLIFLSEDMKNQIAAMENQKNINTNSPNFSFTYLNGTKITKNMLHGKVIVINYWFIGCKGCIEEINSLNELVDKYEHNSEVVFLAPSTDSRQELINFLFTTEFKYKITTINDDSSEKENSFYISVYPTHIIIGKDGKIKYIKAGSSKVIVNLLAAQIEKCLHPIIRNNTI